MPCKWTSSLKQYMRFLVTHKKVKMTKLLVWLTVVVGVTTGCIITVTERIDNLISDPTATTISSIRHHALTFPAVTVCNLNSFTSEKLKERNVTDLLQLTALTNSGET